MRLEKLVESVIPLHTRVLRPRHRKITLSTQIDAFEGQYPNKTKRGQLMSYFFESLTRALYGGKLNDRMYNVQLNGSVSGGLKPDVVDNARNIHYESKATVSGDALEIDEEQFRKYEHDQYRDLSTRLFYAIYRHSLHGIKKQKRTEDEIFSELTEKTDFSIVLPFSVLIALSDVRGNYLVSSYMGRQTSYQDCFSLRSPTTNRFLTTPEEVLTSVDLNLKDYIIERYLSPSNLTVNNEKIKQFPIVKIYDKNHNKWAKKFAKNYKIETERLLDKGTEGLPVFEESYDEIERKAIETENLTPLNKEAEDEGAPF